MKNTQSRDIAYYCVVFKLFDAEEEVNAAKRYLIINAMGLIPHNYFENALTSKFKSKDI